MSFGQYIKDTRGELKHVAWPTQAQTIAYTILVIAVSIIVAAYLGLSDFLLAKGLGEVLVSTEGTLPNPIQAVTPEFATTSEPIAPIEFNVAP